MRGADLVDTQGAAWRAATAHPFLDGVRDGSLPPAAFDTWLVQDHLFVADLLTFQARLLARAARPAQAPLADGLVALVAEQAWFEEQAARRHLDLDVEPAPATSAYARFFAQLEAGSYPAALTALWALERVYLEAWRLAAPGAPAYREFVDRWSAPGFGDYVAALEGAADAALAEADDSADAEQAFLDVTGLEVGFWDVAVQAGQQAGTHAGLHPGTA